MAAAVVVASALQVGVAFAVRWYPHDLPLVYRARAYDADVAAATAACVAVLAADGYQIAAADSLSGIVYTSAKVVAPETPEIGGEWQITCFIEIRVVREKALVIVQLLAEGGNLGGMSPIEFDLRRARRLYDDFFSKLAKVIQSS